MLTVSTGVYMAGWEAGILSSGPLAWPRWKQQWPPLRKKAVFWRSQIWTLVVLWRYFSMYHQGKQTSVYSSDRIGLGCSIEWLISGFNAGELYIFEYKSDFKKFSRFYNYLNISQAPLFRKKRRWYSKSTWLWLSFDYKLVLRT